MSLLAHSGVAAIDLMATYGPAFMGNDSNGNGLWQGSDGTFYKIAPGQTYFTSDGYVLRSGIATPLSSTTTATISGLTISGSRIVSSLPAAELPVEKREMPVVGYRGWKWESKFRLGLGTRGHLASHAMGPGWQKATETAACATGQPHLAPDPYCGCGLYVIANLDELDGHITIDDSMIVGAVLGWGKVVQHGREGWRAQYARILAFLDCKFSEVQLKNTRLAAKEYQVAVMEREGLERYVKEWGDPFAEPTVTP